MGNVGWIGLGGTSIPTLSGTMLFVLALLLAVITIRTLRAKKISGRTSSILLIAGASTLLSVLTVDDIRSSVMGVVIIENPECQGGTANFDTNMYNPSILTNNCPNAVRINLLEPNCNGVPVEEKAAKLAVIADPCVLDGTVAADGGECSLPVCTPY